MFFYFSNNVFPEIFNRESGFYINKSKTISPIEALGDDNLKGGIT
jgi:hypothetical protein